MNVLTSFKLEATLKFGIQLLNSLADTLSTLSYLVGVIIAKLMKTRVTTRFVKIFQRYNCKINSKSVLML